jgi:hypothetical protein
MDAGCLQIALIVASMNATHRTPNFVVHAPTEKIAQQVGKAAEFYRVELAKEWLGTTMPRWAKPCTVNVKVGHYGAGGATSFSFDRGHVFGWRMRIQGSLERILDSVLPHEVSHTIFACHFRRPLPRWADEGAATLAEDDSEKQRQRRLVNEIIRTTRRIPLRELFAMKEYPADKNRVYTLYAQGYSLADYLIQKKGKRAYLEFLSDAEGLGWDRAIAQHFEWKNVEQLERDWSSWVIAGSPSVKLPEGQMLADRKSGGQDSHIVVRGQTPERETPRPRRSKPPLKVAEAPKLSRSGLRSAVRRVEYSTLMRERALTAPDPRGKKSSLPEPIDRDRPIHLASASIGAGYVRPIPADRTEAFSPPIATERAATRPPESAALASRSVEPRAVTRIRSQSPDPEPVRRPAARRYNWPESEPNDVPLGRPSRVPFDF